ncbi:hypothetical protein [Limosilactobacillus ingluviei]|uniref:hypothetical protein n=1 Tax=Limosilactobacillus ingluviei TaxID=148604 RepID=UPI000ACC33B6|nr:hypothetical protein [Limosilactobacillus ingluviei]
MTTELSREELRRQRSTPRTPQPGASKRPKHVGLHLVAVLAAVFFLGSWWAQQTVLSEQTAQTTLTTPTVVATVQSELNSGLTQYGLTNLITATDTKAVLRQLITEVYQDQPLALDLSAVTERASRRADNTLSVYGVQVPTELTAGVAGTVNTAVNAQLNTSELKTVQQNLQVAKQVASVTLVVSGLLVVLGAVREFFNHALGRYLAVVGLVSGSLLWLLTWLLQSQAATFNFSAAIANSLMTAVVNQVVTTGWQLGGWAVGLGALALVSRWLWRLWRYR